MEFERLLSLFDEPEEELSLELFKEVGILLEKKSVTEEKDLNPQIPVIIDFIQTECARQKALSDAMHDDHKRDYAPLNKVFQEVLV